MFIQNFRKFFFGKYYHSNYLSFKLRKLIEKVNIRKIIGLQLASTIFVAGVVVPQADFISSKVYANGLNQKILVTQNTQTQITFKWPLTNYQISQQYRFCHPGLDLTTSYDDGVLAIADGTVEETTVLSWGYGRYIIIKHDNGYSSLYAHLSKILIQVGDHITQGQTIGTVGSSGWSTGTHLHIEIRSPEGTVNPLEVLPTIPPSKTS